VAEIEAPDLTLTPQQMASNRWYYEREKLRLFPSFSFVGYGSQITGAKGTLDTQYNNTYAIRIEIPNYPYSLPKVWLRDLKPHPDAPHKFNDGSLCIMRSSQWRTHFTVALVVAKTSIWLGKYELWKRNGHHWPGLEQRH
jgi:hypothetical protein